jgi:hypothetical protein
LIPTNLEISSSKKTNTADEKDILNQDQLNITLNVDVFSDNYFNTAGNTISNSNFIASLLQPSSNIQVGASTTTPWFNLALYKGAIYAMV